MVQEVEGSSPSSRPNLLTLSIMKFLKLFILLVFALLASVQFASAKNFVDGELLVKFKEGPYSTEALMAHETLGAEVLETFPTLGWQRVKLPEGVSLDNGMAYYRLRGDIEYVQPNFYYHLLVTPNDPQFTAAGMY